MTAQIWHALPAQLADEAAERLAVRLGPVRLGEWKTCAEPGGALLLAPHEFSAQEREKVCRAARWSWVHLTSAGTDFLDLDTWPTDTLLTRSWSCYGAPLAEYAVHAVLSHEWRGAVPWDLADRRSGAGPDRPPAPEEPATSAGAGLNGARVGVAGWGEAGRRSAAALRALGADVVVLRRSGADETTAGYEVVADPAAVVDADHLIVALPLTPRTRGLFDAGVLGGARPGLHLVNISRPQIVDQDALLRLCRAGRMSATLDVTEPEPLPAGHPLRTVGPVRLSPHVAWRSRGSGWGFLNDFASVACALASGRTPPRAAWSGGDPRRAMSSVRWWRKAET